MWACEGLKCTASEEPSQVPILVRTIYHHFIKTSVLLGISSQISSQITQSIITEGKLNQVTVFDQASKQVRSHMEENLYPNFLQSEIYLSAISSYKADNQESSNLQDNLVNSKQLPASPPPPELPQKPILQTLHEDTELIDVPAITIPQVPRRPDKPKPKKAGLTIKALQASEFERVSVPVVHPSNPEIKRPIIPSKPTGASSVPHPYHAAYSSYNPVSAADSEAQSQSSGGTHSSGRSGGSSSRRHCCSSQLQRNKGPGHYPHPPQSQSGCCAHQKSAGSSRQGPRHINGDNGLKVMLPEGYGRKRINPPPSNPIEFVNLLFPKLEDLKRKREHGNVLADAISRMNLVEEDNGDEGILGKCLIVFLY